MNNMNDFDGAMKSKLLETFGFVIDFLNANNLRWWVTYGTLIGTVRHKGFIPWDDDIDICMPRKDYNRLLTLMGNEEGRYRLISYKNDRTYCQGFAKIYDANTSILEGRGSSYVIGVYVDVFPVDYFSCDEALMRDKFFGYDRLLRRVKLASASFDCGDCWWMVKGGHLRTLVDAVKGLPLKGKMTELKRKLEEYEMDIYEENGKFCMLFSVTNFRYYNSKLFDGAIVMPFENLMVNVPSGYDEILRECYGDYMSLPPESERIPSHGHYYDNLKEGLTYDEVKRRLANGEYKVF